MFAAHVRIRTAWSETRTGIPPTVLAGSRRTLEGPFYRKLANIPDMPLLSSGIRARVINCPGSPYLITLRAGGGAVVPRVPSI